MARGCPEVRISSVCCWFLPAEPCAALTPAQSKWYPYLMNGAYGLTVSKWCLDLIRIDGCLELQAPTYTNTTTNRT